MVTPRMNRATGTTQGGATVIENAQYLFSRTTWSGWTHEDLLTGFPTAIGPAHLVALMLAQTAWLDTCNPT